MICFEPTEPCNCTALTQDNHDLYLDLWEQAAELFSIATDHRFGDCETEIFPCFKPGFECTPCEMITIKTMCGPGCVTETNRFEIRGATRLISVVIDGVMQTGWRFRHGWVYPPAGWVPPVSNSSAGGVGSWSITVSFQEELPASAAATIASLACEMLKQCVGKPCDLPSSLLHRLDDGSWVIEPTSYRKQGLTGFKPMDDWISTWRGGRARLAPTVTLTK